MTRSQRRESGAPMGRRNCVRLHSEFSHLTANRVILTQPFCPFRAESHARSSLPTALTAAAGDDLITATGIAISPRGDMLKYRVRFSKGRSMSIPYTSILSKRLSRLVGASNVPTLVAARKDNDFAKRPLMIPGAIRRSHFAPHGAVSRREFWVQKLRDCMAPLWRQYRASTCRLSRFRSRPLPRSSVSTSEALVVLVASCISGILLGVAGVICVTRRFRT
jgi:hypothetical protein